MAGWCRISSSWASTLQICTAVLRFGIGIIGELLLGLQGWMEEKGFQSMTDVIGRSLPYLVEHSQLPRGIQEKFAMGVVLAIRLVERVDIKRLFWWKGSRR